MPALLFIAAVISWATPSSSFAATHMRPTLPTAFSSSSPVLAPLARGIRLGAQRQGRPGGGLLLASMDMWENGEERRGRSKQRAATKESDPMLQANADVAGRFNVTWDVSQLVTHHSYSQLLLDNTINSTDTDAVGKEGTAARRGSASPRRGGGDDRVVSGKRGDGKVSEALRKELQEVLAEHAEINKLSDDLRDRGREAGSLVHFQLRSLKKRKLAIKDRIQSLEARIAQVESHDASPDQDTDDMEEVDDEDGAGIAMVLSRLEQVGQRPDSVPDHIDSVFLATVKGLQQSGLRPLGYDFREQEVIGVPRQFPHAAKRAKRDIMRMLGAQAHRLNGIGGWPLSNDEFSRYFLRAWWTVEGATHDLFMAASHMYAVRIVVLNLEDDLEGGALLQEEVYEATEESRATLWLCREGSHVISTRPLKGTRSASLDTRKGTRSASLDARKGTRSRSASPMMSTRSASVDSSKGTRSGSVGGRSRSRSMGRDGIQLGDVLQGLDDGYSIYPDGEGQEDEEVDGVDVEGAWRGKGDMNRAVRGMYAGTTTKKLFVMADICESGRKGITSVKKRIRESFPLGDKALEDAVRWSDMGECHITLGELEVPGGGGAAAVESTVSAVSHQIMALGLEPFSVRASHLGCFWSTASSGWGRLPRVLFAGLDESTLWPLMQMRSAIADGSTISVTKRPFHAHITLAKMSISGAGDGSSDRKRRVLRVLGKWAQDPRRSFRLQQSLGGGDKDKGWVGGGGGSAGGEGRGRRAKARFVAEQGGGRGRGERKRDRRKGRGERDLGGLNAEQAEEAWTGNPASLSQGWSEAWDFGIRVNSFSVVEAVKVEGEGIRYVTLRKVLL